MVALEGDSEGSLRSVTRALCGNSIVATLKFFAAFLTGSSAMLSEAIHSLGDVANQIALLVGIKRGIKRADRRFPFGRGKERYAWNVVAIMLVGFLGGISALHGFQTIASGHIPDYLTKEKVVFSAGAISINSFLVVQFVLGASLFIEGYTLWVAKQVVWKQKGPDSLWKYVHESSDPTGYAVLFEDSVAVVGIIVAAAGIWLTVSTGNPVFDGVAAVIIAAMMLSMAIFLLFINIVLITGRSDEGLEKEMAQFILADPNVERVHRISTEMCGAGIVSVDVWVELNEEAIYSHVSNGSGESIPRKSREIVEVSYARITAIVDSLRKSVMQKFPEVQFLCIEPEFPTAKSS